MDEKMREGKRRNWNLGGWAAMVLCFAALAGARGDEVDDVITAQMQEHQIAGVSLAIFEEGKIIREQGYGFVDAAGSARVTPGTLFQAGSISKPVAAVGALRLVETGILSLDEDVNGKLRSWTVPENQFTKDKKVTLRRLLSHSAGLTVHGFRGYERDAAVPTLVQVLDGAKPAVNSPIRVEATPGSKVKYSGGGYVVMQQLVEDVTGEPFAGYMRRNVLDPLGMTNSTYEQPLPAGKVAAAATGHYTDGRAVKGGWHVYPEKAPAGLWTTAPDLARFAIGIQRSLAGQKNGVISQQTAAEMVTRQKDDVGLGLFLRGTGQKLMFSHSGRNEGFDAEMAAYAHRGKGAVILINANNDSGAIKAILRAIAKEYRWPPS